MRYLIVMVFLAGCTYNVTLHQRGGQEKLYGVFDPDVRTLTVTVDGERYRTGAVQGRVDSVGFAFTPNLSVVPATATSRSNQYTVLLQTDRGMIRCAFAIDGAHGNGSCEDDKARIYDMVLLRGQR